MSEQKQAQNAPVQLNLLYLQDNILLLEIPMGEVILNVFQFLESNHQGKYKIFDVSDASWEWPTDKDPEVQYFQKQFGLSFIFKAASSIDKWIASKSGNLAVICDLPMKGRSGAVACASLFALRKFPTIADSINFLKAKQSGHIFLPTSPSLTQSLNLFEKCFLNSQLENYHLKATRITIQGLLDPYREQLSCSIIQKNGDQIEEKIMPSEWQPISDAEVSIALQVPLCGDCIINFFDSSSGHILFLISFHTAFLQIPELFSFTIQCFNKWEIDIFNNKAVDSQFLVTIFLSRIEDIPPITSWPWVQWVQQLDQYFANEVVEEPENKLDLFGLPLEEACKISPSPDSELVPLIISFSVEFLLVTGLDEDSLFVTPVAPRAIEQLKQVFEQGNWNEIGQKLSQCEPHLVAALLKQFLKSLPDKLIPFEKYSNFLKICEEYRDKPNALIVELRNLVANLPPCNRSSLARLFQLFHKIDESPHSESNSKQLAMNFVPLLLKSEEKVQQKKSRWQTQSDRVANVADLPALTDGIAIMISNWSDVFSGTPMNLQQLQSQQAKSVPQQQQIQVQEVAVSSHVASSVSSTPNKPMSSFEKWKRKLSQVFGVKSDDKNEASPLIAVKLFGGTLDTVPAQYMSDEEPHIPLVVKICIDDLVNGEGLKCQGLFRVPGAHNAVEELQQAFEAGDQAKIKTILQKSNDPATVAGVLKIYFRLLAEPLIPFDMYENFISIFSQSSTWEEKIAPLMEFINPLSNINKDVLKILISFLYTVSCSPETHMNAKNLAICFAPNLVRPRPEDEDPMASLTLMPYIIEGICFLIENAKTLFPEPRVEKRTHIRSTPSHGSKTLPPNFDPSTPVEEIPRSQKYKTVVIRGDVLQQHLSALDETSDDILPPPPPEPPLDPPPPPPPEEELKRIEEANDALIEAIQSRLICALRETIPQAEYLKVDSSIVSAAKALYAQLLAEEELLRFEAEAAEQARLEEEQYLIVEEQARLEEEARIKDEQMIYEEEALRRKQEIEERIVAAEKERDTVISQHIPVQVEEEAPARRISSYMIHERELEQEEAARKIEEAQNVLRQQEEQARIDLENRLKAEGDARKELEERLETQEMERKKLEQRLVVEEEARRNAEQEAKIKSAEANASRIAEEEARRKVAEATAKRRAAEEARIKAIEEADLKAEEARKKAEEEYQIKMEEERKRTEIELQKAEEEARQKAEEEDRLKAEEEARQKAEEEACQKAEEEARLKAEEARIKEEARLKAEEEARKRLEDEARERAEKLAQMKKEEEKRKQQIQETKKSEAEIIEQKKTEDSKETQMKAEMDALRKAQHAAKVRAEKSRLIAQKEEFKKAKQTKQAQRRKIVASHGKIGSLADRTKFFEKEMDRAAGTPPPGHQHSLSQPKPQVISRPGPQLQPRPPGQLSQSRPQGQLPQPRPGQTRPPPKVQSPEPVQRPQKSPSRIQQPQPRVQQQTPPKKSDSHPQQIQQPIPPSQPKTRRTSEAPRERTSSKVHKFAAAFEQQQPQLPQTPPPNKREQKKFDLKTPVEPKKSQESKKSQPGSQQGWKKDFKASDFY